MKRNAFFQLIHKKDGMYLKSYPAVEGGDALKADDIMSYLSSKKYENVTVETIKQFMEKAAKEKNAEIKISSKSALPEHEYALITIDPMRMYAKIRLYPNSSEGRRLSVSDIMMLLEQHGIKQGFTAQIFWLPRQRRLSTAVMLS